MRRRSAFTLIEVLISIALLGLIVPALYKTVSLLQESNTQLYEHLQKSKDEARALRTFYLDIASSDGNISLHQDEFDRICLERTKNALYGLSQAKVCWVVLKRGNKLVRIEGDRYHVPLKLDETVEADLVADEVEHFDVIWQKDKIIVVLKKKGSEPTTFMVQGITKPKPKKKKKKLPRKGSTNSTKKNDRNATRPLTPSSTK